MDWTVKIWSPNTRLQPLFSFESSQEYVYDAQWSTTHPGVFASCNGEGIVDIWNINKDRESPIVHKPIQDKSRPLNSLRWNNDGRRIAVGDSKGYISILQVDPELSTPKNEDFDRITELLQDSN
jgi:dynein intermediate chain